VQGLPVVAAAGAHGPVVRGVALELMYLAA
jgi:hypothetical protein